MSSASDRADDRKLAWAYEAARASWCLPLLGSVVLSLLNKSLPETAPVATRLALPGILALGFAAAIFAIVYVPRVGRRSIRTHAVVGLILNGFFLFGFLLAVLRRLI
jgi:hypothetical protein